MYKCFPPYLFVRIRLDWYDVSLILGVVDGLGPLEHSSPPFVAQSFASTCPELSGLSRIITIDVATVTTHGIATFSSFDIKSYRPLYSLYP